MASIVKAPNPDLESGQIIVDTNRIGHASLLQTSTHTSSLPSLATPDIYLTFPIKTQSKRSAFI